MASNAKPMVLVREIETYRKELSRLLAAGQAGQFVRMPILTAALAPEH